MKCVVAGIVLMCVGCLTDPGRQTAVGLRQEGKLNYTLEALDYHWSGSQENNAWFYEGDPIVLNADGSVNHAESRITAAVRLEPSAGPAATTMAMLAQVLEAQSQMVSDRIQGLENLLNNLLPLFAAASGGGAGGAGNPSRLSGLLEEIKTLRELVDSLTGGVSPGTDGQ